MFLLFLFSFLLFAFDYNQAWSEASLASFDLVRDAGYGVHINVVFLVGKQCEFDPCNWLTEF